MLSTVEKIGTKKIMSLFIKKVVVTLPLKKILAYKNLAV